jgi:hypothetical protein
MSTAGERTTQAPEGAVSVTAKDVIAVAVPDRFEDVEYWALKTTTGLTETLRIRKEIGEKGELQVSPLDGSVLGLKFEFHSGDAKNEVTGRRFVPVASLFYFDIAFHKDPVYKNGESPAEVELKRRQKLREQSIQERAAKLAENLDDTDIDEA